MASKKKSVPKETWPRFPGESQPEDLTLNAPTAEEEMAADWATVQGKEPPPREGQVPKMTSEELKKFVLDYLANQIFTSANIRQTDLVPMVFLPMAFGGLQTFTDEAIKDIAIVYAYMHEAVGSRSINGYPIFGSMRVMHRDDWARACAAIKRESDRQHEIEV